MAVDLQLTGEGIAAIVFACGTGLTSAYGMYRTIRQDRKLDAQQAALAIVGAKQDDAHATLVQVAGTVAAVQTSVAKVEVQTNHLTQALVEKTALASHAEGVADEKARAGKP